MSGVVRRASQTPIRAARSVKLEYCFNFSLYPIKAVLLLAGFSFTLTTNKVALLQQIQSTQESREDMLNKKLRGDHFFWVVQAVCALHRKPFSSELAQQQLAAPYTTDSLLSAVQAYGFDAALRKTKAEKLHKESFPLIAWLDPKPSTTPVAAD